MQTAAYRPPQMATSSLSADPVRTSVAHLLTRAVDIPCTAAAQAFTQLVQPANRFTVSLDILLPLLSGNSELPRRIVAAYILYALYAAHPITINPFRSAFVEVFGREREQARFEAERGGVSANEQLVWIIWKILKGDGSDLGPYTPAQLMNSPLPPRLRASHLTIDESIGAEDESFREQSMNGKLLTPISTDGSPGHLLVPRTPDSAISVSPVPSNDELKAEYLERGKQLLITASQRVLTLSEQRAVALILPHLYPQNILALHTIPTLIALNPALGHPLVVQILGKADRTELYTSFSQSDVLEMLRKLPPTLPSFDVIGRLLRDPTSVPASDGGQYIDRYMRNASADYGARKTTIADLVRTEVLGAFVLNSIGWVERTEREALEGLVSDDRAAKGVQNLCRFYNSLIKLNLVDVTSHADSVEMAHFALAHAQYEDANALYRVLVMGKF